MSRQVQPHGGTTKPSLLLRTAMNWKPYAARLGLAFALALMMNPLPTARVRTAIAGRPNAPDFSPQPALPQLRIRDIMSTWRTAEALAAEDAPKPTVSNKNDA